VDDDGGVIKPPHDVTQGVAVSQRSQELIPQPLPPMRPNGEAGYVDELDRGGDRPGTSSQSAEALQGPVPGWDLRLVGVDCAKGEVGNLCQRLLLGQGVEQGGLATLGSPNMPTRIFTDILLEVPLGDGAGAGFWVMDESRPRNVDKDDE
jgi:hypothetical protein